MSDQHEQFSKRLNETIRRSRGYTPAAPMSEERQRINDAIRAQARTGTVERDATTGELLAVDGKPVEDEGE